MPVNKCRVCGNKFFKEPLLQYENMPKAAQFLPDKHTLKSDRGTKLKVYQCRGCGLVQLSNSPVLYYKEVIRAAGFSQVMINFRKKQFSSFVKRFSLKGKKIVEIGCGNGEYLSVIERCGVKAYGLEYSRLAVRHCLKQGLKVCRGFVQNSSLKLKHAPFDAFFTLMFLEHLPNHGLVLGGIYNNLADGAVGLVEVPNFDMILGKKLFSEFIPDHLFYFTKDTLNTLLRLNGFEIIECKEIWHNYIISAVVKKREKLDLSYFYKHQANLKKEIKEYLCRFKNKKVAIWGAGHQALAVLSLIDAQKSPSFSSGMNAPKIIPTRSSKLSKKILTYKAESGVSMKPRALARGGSLNLSGKIRYVIDSATFKHGKYTPVAYPHSFPRRIGQKSARCRNYYGRQLL